jgi:RNA polymerase sigma factor (sigma-70 family)
MSTPDNDSPNRPRPDSRGETPARGETLAGATFAPYHAGLQRFLMRRLRSAQNAQDLAQEAYLRLLRIGRGELVRKPQAYLYRIAANLVYEFQLRERQDPVTFDSRALEHLAEHPVELPADDTSDQHEIEEVLARVLAQLPPLYRAVFVLRKRDGMSYIEIASQLRISVHTVKKYLARAMALCRAANWDR